MGCVAAVRRRAGRVRVAILGLVARRVSPRDRRARELSLTAQGKALLAEAKPVVAALQAEILAGLDTDERTTFLLLLQKATEAGNALSRAPLKL